MTDEHYKEEQQNEIDILQSIYPTEFEEIATDPYKYSIRIQIEDEEEIRPCAVILVVEYTPTYPDELPEFDLLLEEEDEEDAKPLTETDATLSDVDIEDMKAKARETAEESIGMAMVFGMASTLKEVCAERLREKTEALKKIREERIKKEIEAEQAKFVGTLVTRANFLEWKEKFDRENEELKQAEQSNTGDSKSAARRALAGGAAGSKNDGKLSGRELFEQDRALAQSDSKFIADGDVSVDASLFAKEEYISDDDDDN
ncbi:rwd domain-containing protein [Coemansia sp. RSA 2559]|nr:rwd domain-containing protein [Coemansia sp. RSA 2559]KAJ2867399.1 rwd domain-containing protein [Coemansia erecta]